MTSKNEKSTTESVVEMHIQALTDQRREREDALAQVRAHFATLGTKIDALDAQRDALGAERDQLIVRLVDSGIPKKSRRGNLWPVPDKNLHGTSRPRKVG